MEIRLSDNPIMQADPCVSSDAPSRDSSGELGHPCSIFFSWGEKPAWGGHNNEYQNFQCYCPKTWNIGRWWATVCCYRHLLIVPGGLCVVGRDGIESRTNSLALKDLVVLIKVQSPIKCNVISSCVHVKLFSDECKSTLHYKAILVQVTD